MRPCFSKNCRKVDGLQQCHINYPTSTNWLDEVNQGWMSLQLDITFDSQPIIMENHSGYIFSNIKNFAMDVDLAPSLSTCQSKLNTTIVRRQISKCLHDEDVIKPLNQILILMPNIIHFKLQLLSHLSLGYYFPPTKFNSLRSLSVVGFRLIFKGPLDSLSTGFSILEFKGASIKSLEELNFQSCCKKLKNLFLGYNEIESVSKPLQVKGLEVLDYLVLRNNRITKIENNNFFKSFKELFSINLNDNQISFIGSLAFADLKKLKSISLKGNWLNSIPVFQSVFGSPYSIQDLALSYNNITEFDVDPLLELSNLSHLDLSNNCIDKIYFSRLQNLKKLILSNNCIEYFKVDGSSHNLKSLRLDGNRLTNFTEDQIIIFNTSKSNLFELDLSRNPFRNCGMFTDWTHDHESKLSFNFLQYSWNFSDFQKVLKLLNVRLFVCHHAYDQSLFSTSTVQSLPPPSSNLIHGITQLMIPAQRTSFYGLSTNSSAKFRKPEIGLPKPANVLKNRFQFSNESLDIEPLHSNSRSRHSCTTLWILLLINR